MLRRADAGKHQELGRVEGATAKNHLARRFGAHDLAVLHVLDANRVRAPQQQARGLSAGCDDESLARPRRHEVGGGGR